MTAILPQGLISPAATAQNTFEETSSTLDNQEILRRFWRVYAIQSDASHDSASVRARNLFWRVWSCPRLAQSISSNTLMRLLRRTGQEFESDPIGDSIRLPPLRSRQVSHDSKQLAVETPLLSSGSSTSQGQRSFLQDLRFPVAGASREEEQRLQSSTQTQASVQQSDDTSGSTSNTASETSSRPSLTKSGGNGRQRLPVLAAVGKYRTRPQLPRRKSSTPKPPSGANPPKSPHESLEKGGSTHVPQEAASLQRPIRGGPSSGLLKTSSTTSGATFALPSASSWQSIDSTTENRKLATTAPQPTLGDLVDPGFRVKFVESQKKLSSVTNLAGLGKVRKSLSTVRFADESPEDSGKSKGKGKEKEILPPLEDVRQGPSHMKSTLKSAVQRQQERDDRRDDSEDDSYSDTDEGEDEDEDDEEDEDEEDDEDDDEDDDDDNDDNLQMQLPRTKSQLSLLIQHKRDQTGSQDIGPTSSPEESVKPRIKEKSKEEELLSMGRRDGVTKAGGVQIPRQQRVVGRDEPEDLPSSSPEPLF